MRRFLCLAGIIWCAVALRAVSTPQIGMVRCRDGAVYALYGLHANFLTGERAFSLAQAASFSDQAGLVASGGRLMLIGADRTVQSTYFEGEESPVLNVDGATSSAIAWFPRRSELMVWNGSQFVGMAVQSLGLAGKVDAVRISAVNLAELLVTESDGSVDRVTVSISGGVITNISAIPGATGSAFEQQSFLLFHDANGLEVQASNGTMRTLAITQSDLSFERIGTDWVHISSASAQRDWVLHLNATVLELSELPEPPENSPLSKPMPISMPRTPGAAE